jgi:hypothetical protein
MAGRRPGGFPLRFNPPYGIARFSAHEFLFAIPPHVLALAEAFPELVNR